MTEICFNTWFIQNMKESWLYLSTLLVYLVPQVILPINPTCFLYFTPLYTQG